MIVIGHRGFPARAPENTLASFRTAMEAGVRMIELDVALSKDRVPVIIHDDTLNRTTNGRGKISAYTLNEIKQLDAGSWFNDAFREEKIPTLEEVLILIKDKIAINIEIKESAVTDDAKNGVEKLVVDLFKKFNLKEPSIVSSFGSLPLFRIREIDSSIPIAFLIHRRIHEDEKGIIEKLLPQAVHLPIDHFQNTDIEYLNKKLLPIRLFTVNEIAQMELAKKIGADGIFTNEVERALQFFGSSSK